MRLALLTPIFVAVVFACPSPQEILQTAVKLNIPVKKIVKVELFKKLPILCRAEAVVGKDGFNATTDLFTTADGKFFIPFVGRVIYEPSGEKDIKKLTIVSIRNSTTSFTLGYVTNDLKYYFPAMIPIKNTQSVENKTENKTSAVFNNSTATEEGNNTLNP